MGIVLRDVFDLAMHGIRFRQQFLAGYLCIRRVRVFAAFCAWCYRADHRIVGARYPDQTIDYTSLKTAAYDSEPID